MDEVAALKEKLARDLSSMMSCSGMYGTKEKVVDDIVALFDALAAAQPGKPLAQSIWPKKAGESNRTIDDGLE